MMKIRRTFILVSLVLGLTKTYATESTPFSISSKGQVEVQWKGKTILSTDTLDCVVDHELKEYDGYQEERVDGKLIQNLWKYADPYKNVNFRREVVSDKNGVELSVQYRVPSYYYQQEGLPGDLNSFYRVRIPKKGLKGLKYKARIRTGAGAGGVKTVSGVIGEESENHIKGTRISSLTIYLKEGKTISYDFAPAGIAVFNAHISGSSLPSAWWAGADEEYLRFAIGRLKDTTYPHNGIYMGKIRVSEDSFEAWEQWHFHHYYKYFMEMPPLRQLSFGAGKIQDRWAKKDLSEITDYEWRSRGQKEFWLSVGEDAYSENNAFGWENPQEILKKGDVSKSILQGWAESKTKTPQTFRMKVPIPGIYLFVLRTGSVGKTGRFSLLANETSVAINKSLIPDNIQEITFARQVDEEIALTFSGSWALSSLAVQPLMTNREDYVFRERFWLIEDIPTPSTLYQFERRPIPEEAVVHQFPKEWKEERSPTVRKNLALPPDAPGAEWRWTGSITGLGPDNNGTFYEFDTPELINRRLDEIQKIDLGTLLVNGLLVRHAYPEQEEHIAEAMSLIVREAHKRGIKVVDHFDLTIIANIGAAYQQFVENLDWAAKDVRNGQFTRGYCINNPHFQEYFTEKMVEYVKRTGIDGLMLDEMTYHDKFYCGCFYCREKFYNDTGFTLPVEETDPDMMNGLSRVWKKWIKWKMEARPDFALHVLEEVQKINPAFVWMGYGAPITFTSDYSGKKGADGGLSRSYISFYGIETISNNLHATHRFHLVSESIHNALFGDLEIPKMDLLYPKGETTFAYSGWIMGNMNGHRLWAMLGRKNIEDDFKRYTSWEDNVDIRTVKLRADIGVFFSQESRDFSQDPPRFTQETIGLMQQLDDLHLSYEVFLSYDATLEKLKQYPLIIAPGVSSISNKDLSLLYQYVQQGGKLFTTGSFAIEDELGIPREEWGLQKWIPVQYESETSTGASLSVPWVDKKPFVLKFPVTLVRVNSGDSVQSLATVITKEGAFPGVISADIGDGELIWSAFGLGIEDYEADGRVGRLWDYRENKESKQFLGKLISFLLAEKQFFEAVHMPEAVKTRVYQSRPESKEQAVYIHLFNATGGVIRAQGKEVPAKQPVNPYPALKEDIVFKLNLPPRKYRAILASTDFEGRVEIPVVQNIEGTQTVTVPAAMLKAYSLIRVMEIDETSMHP